MAAYEPKPWPELTGWRICLNPALGKMGYINTHFHAPDAQCKWYIHFEEKWNYE